MPRPTNAIAKQPKSAPAKKASDQSTKTDPTNPRVRAVQLRLAGETLARTAEQTGLSTPTVSALIKAYEAGGWDAINQRAAGRPKGGSKASQVSLAHLRDKLLTEQPRTVWTIAALAQWLKDQSDTTPNKRAAIRRLADWDLLPPDATNQLGHLYPNPNTAVLWARGPKSEVYLQVCPLPVLGTDYLRLAQTLHHHHPKGLALKLADDGFAGLRYTPQLAAYLNAHPEISFVTHNHVELQTMSLITLSPTKAETSSKSLSARLTRTNAPDAQSAPTNEKAHTVPTDTSVTIGSSTLTHLQRLEAESIAILREVVAESDNPVMLYSIGKDSAVMLHLAVKAFYPAKIPFPLLHVDTTWKFQDMYRFRARMQEEHDFKLLVHTNPEGLAQGINPFTHGSQIHTDIMKTLALKQALDKYSFDVAFGGARRDEEKSRAKERVFSFRTKDHRWDPKNQRPELWNLYNTKKHKGESIRVFPISNWTELDIWQYIYLEDIPIVPLYFSAPRPVVNRGGTLIMIDDDRMPLAPDEVPMIKSVRFRTLGCYPLTGAVESKAATLQEVIQEMLLTKTSERQGRVIDHDAAASMEKKKQEGYF
jgi:sulfate adenylyltransferase subunit 2